jgi:hypothetical protein
VENARKTYEQHTEKLLTANVATKTAESAMKATKVANAEGV